MVECYTTPYFIHFKGNMKIEIYEKYQGLT